MLEDGVWHVDVAVRTEEGEFEVTASGDLAEAMRGVYLRLGNYKVLWQELD